MILNPKDVEPSDSITLIIHASIWPAIASIIIILIVVAILYFVSIKLYYRIIELHFIIREAVLFAVYTLINGIATDLLFWANDSHLQMCLGMVDLQPFNYMGCVTVTGMAVRCSEFLVFGLDGYS